jgi:hypothetical protein
MADISDVETAIVNLLGTLIYPNGTSQSSSVGATVKIYRGWPVPASLDTDLAAGVVNISVISRQGTERNETKYPVYYYDISVPLPTFTATVSNNTITISGVNSATIDQFITIIIGTRATTSVQVVASTDTASTIATNVAAAISEIGFVATAVGAVVTVTTGAPLQAAFYTQGEQQAEIRRQTVQMQITAWCANPTIRDTIAKAIEPTLSATTFLTLIDSTAARFRYRTNYVSDTMQKQALYRRDFIYDVEYPTTLQDIAWQVGVINANIEGGQDNLGLGPQNFNYNPAPPEYPSIDIWSEFEANIP